MAEEVKLMKVAEKGQGCPYLCHSCAPDSIWPCPFWRSDGICFNPSGWSYSGYWDRVINDPDNNYWTEETVQDWVEKEWDYFLNEILDTDIYEIEEYDDFFLVKEVE